MGSDGLEGGARVEGGARPHRRRERPDQGRAARLLVRAGHRCLRDSRPEYTRHVPLQPGHRVVVDELGEEPLDAIAHHARLVPMQPPDPATLGDHDVIIAIKSASVGWVDLLMTSGQYQHPPKPPYTPGLEYAGVVAGTGRASPASPSARRWWSIRSSPGPGRTAIYQAQGGFASYAVVPRRRCSPCPTGCRSIRRATCSATTRPRITASSRAVASRPARPCSSMARPARPGSRRSTSRSCSARR